MRHSNVSPVFPSSCAVALRSTFGHRVFHSSFEFGGYICDVNLILNCIILELDLYLDEACCPAVSEFASRDSLPLLHDPLLRTPPPRSRMSLFD